MTDLREKVAVAISGAPFPSANSLRKADAAIAAVLEALKEPSKAMEDAAYGASLDIYWGYRDDGPGEPKDAWNVMLTAFTRDHYLSALAEEDAKEL